MLSNIYAMKSTNEDLRLLRIHIDRLERANEAQKEKRKKAEDELQQEIKKNKQLEHDLDKLKKLIIKYKEMLFGCKKKSTGQDDAGSGDVLHLPPDSESSQVSSLRKTRKPGGQFGHTGHHKKKPVPDTTTHLRLTSCTTCGTPLDPGNTVESHTVTEIPHPESQKATTTQYDIERQWCSQCGKEVHALPPSPVLIGVGFGINLLTTVLSWRNHFHDPLNKMVERLQLSYGIDISEGTLQNMLIKGHALLKQRHATILKEVRGSPIKHADETTWSVNGYGAWVFGYSTKTLTYHEVSESRGKYALDDMISGGVPSTMSTERLGSGERIGSGERDREKRSLLVTDSYACYDDTPFDHQSCWSHHLRKSHEVASYEHASCEARDIHRRLCTIYDFLHQENQKPFVYTHREVVYETAMKHIDVFLSHTYHHEDAIEVHTRIHNQRNTLARALLHEGAPLTNNQAERDVRSMVIKRKISGGSRSWRGANATATNTSVIATIRKQHLPLFDTLQRYLLGNVE